jgi:hypothetical protein
MWDCQPGCPIASLDEQSGVKKNGGQNVSQGQESIGVHGWKHPVDNATKYAGDVGGASRFFQQIQEKKTPGISSELVQYLLDLISPPPPSEPAVFLSLDDKMQFPKRSLTGIVLQGTPTEEQSKELLRVLLPGAHLVLIALDENPIGDMGACVVEDAGFEIRDSILIVDEDKYFHYVPKASRSEREAGCFQIPGKSSSELDLEDVDEDQIPTVVHNFHPTIKTVALMQRLLKDVPKDEGPIVDNFCGSGSTLIACIKTGHEAIGIEKDPEYLQIAEARVRHCDLNYHGWIPTEIISEAPPLPTPQKTMSLFDFGEGEEE